jgi:hypothetical protein
MIEKYFGYGPPRPAATGQISIESGEPRRKSGGCIIASTAPNTRMRKQIFQAHKAS